MKKNILWKIFLIIGVVPFIIPFIFSFTRMSTWTLLDWLIMYSFIYWPTYIVGMILIIISIYKIIKLKNKKS